MAMLTVRKLPDEVHRALRVRAAQRSHSMAAEVRDILATAVSPNGRVELGTLLSDLGGAPEARGIGAVVGGRASPSSLIGPWCASVARFRGALPQACGPVSASSDAAQARPPMGMWSSVRHTRPDETRTKCFVVAGSGCWRGRAARHWWLRRLAPGRGACTGPRQRAFSTSAGSACRSPVGGG